MTATTLHTRPGFNPIHSLGQALRFASALAVAAVITVSLFFLMRTLIAVEAAPPEPAVDQPPITIALEVEEFEIDPDLGPEPVENVVVPPSVRPPPVDPQARPTEALTTGIGPIEADPDTTEIGVISRLPSPISIKVPPVYPSRELSRGIEGSCIIQYDVLGDGRTANAEVVRCDSPGFARASLDAVADWRHSVVMGDDPNTIVNRGLQTRLDFRLDG